MMRTTRSRCLAIALLGCLASPARAVVLFEAGAGFRQPELFDLKQGIDPQKIDFGEFSFGGALCPAPGTPNFLCASVLSESTVEGGRLLVRSKARIKRTNAASTSPETAAYADTRLTVTEIGGYASTAPKAAFYFGLSGTLTKTGGAPGVILQAFSRAMLQAGDTTSNQCFGLETSCIPPVDPYRVVVENWNPTTGFYLMLRSDVAAVATGFPAPGGWDAEVVADFADTMEILSIVVMDENEVPIPGVQLTVLDGEGNTITFPNVPVPEPGQAVLAATGALTLACARRRRRAVRPR
jgi:hypothetical protein